MKNAGQKVILQNYKEVLWTTLCKQIRQLRWKEQIPRKTQMTKIDSRIENLNRPIMSIDTDSVIKNICSKKRPYPDGFPGEFY